MHFPSRALPPLLLSFAHLAAQSPICSDLSRITALANEEMTSIAGLPGLCLQIDQHGQNLYRQAFGSYTLQQVVPLASATKMLSAAVLMALVDQQLLQLDDPVGTYLPEYAVPPRDQITLRMCFSHTSGLPRSTSWESNSSITLRQAAQNIATVPLSYLPGTAFEYGSAAMQVAGAVCEVVSGMTWAQLFQQKLAVPLGFIATDYNAFGLHANPRIAGGARSNLQDYGRFVEMLRAGGAWNGTQVLSAAAVDAMMTDNTSHLPTVYSPSPYGSPYGIGCWIDQKDSAGRTTHVSSPGFYGFTGWVDRARDVTGVYLINYNGYLTFPYFFRFVAATDAALSPIGVGCVGAGSPSCGTEPRLNASTWARAGLADYRFRVDDAPANTAGLLLLDLAPQTLPSQVLGLSIWIGLPAPVTGGLMSDAQGHAELQSSLAGIAAGQTFALQSVWLDGGGCGAFGVRASHALTVSVQP
ncbi:MAG: beta-lactamase family protein [Planctomycetes bacterium]|nr:beta-lactamase family protein [Planctomycetota bacterium]